MDDSLDEWLAEYQRLKDALEPYCDQVREKEESLPTIKPDSTESERVFWDLYYYWQAALVNASDVFGYLPYIKEHEADFAAIGAKGTLEALRKLMPYFSERKALADEDAKYEYLLRTMDERAAIESLAEDTLDFGRLLLAYAEKNLNKNHGD